MSYTSHYIAHGRFRAYAAPVLLHVLRSETRELFLKTVLVREQLGGTRIFKQNT